MFYSYTLSLRPLRKKEFSGNEPCKEAVTIVESTVCYSFGIYKIISLTNRSAFWQQSVIDLSGDKKKEEEIQKKEKIENVILKEKKEC